MIRILAGIGGACMLGALCAIPSGHVSLTTGAIIGIAVLFWTLIAVRMLLFGLTGDRP